jgi:hypothetical protein
MFICPAHAETFRRAGWGKAEIQKAMYAKARMPFEKLMLVNRLRKPDEIKEHTSRASAHPELEWLWDSPQTMLPVVEDPECFEIVVVGGAAGRGAFFWGSGQPRTKEITE